MKKMTLDLDSLAIESFAVAEQPGPRGELRAVAGQETSFPDPCWSDVSVCARCFYTANCCECGSWVS